MGWVVKSLHGEALAALAAAGASGLLRDAERDARRIRRSAAREADHALAALVDLEMFGLEAREGVRAERQRVRSRAAGRVARVTAPVASAPRPAARTPRPVPLPAAPAMRAPGTPEPEPASAARAGTPLARAAGPLRRRGRASLRESPVVELFRRT